MQQRFGKMKEAGIRNVRELLAKSATGTKWSQARHDLIITVTAHRLKPFSN
jgi:hypothetical protein